MSTSTTPLTQNQKLLWIGQELNPKSPMYNMVMTYKIQGVLSLPIFEEAFGRVVSSSDALRSVFENQQGVVVQKYKEDIEYTVEYVDFSNNENPTEAYTNWKSKRVQKLFNLKELAFDSVFIKISECIYIWYINQHHLITDGWSTSILYQELIKHYTSILEGNGIREANLPKFKDFVTDTSNNEATNSLSDVKLFWKQKMESITTIPQLYFNTTSALTTNSNRLTLNLGKERSEKIKAFANKKGVRVWTLDLTLYNFFLTSLFAYVHRISGQQNLVIGSPTHNRTTKEYQKTIGFFVEIFPLLTKIDSEDTFMSLLKKVQVESNSFLKNAKTGASSSQVNRNFNVFFNYMLNTTNPDFRDFLVQTEWEHPGHTDPRHHLRLHVYDFDNTGEIKLYFDLNTAIFSTTLQQEAPQHFLNIIDAFISNENQKIETVGFATLNEISKIKDWNNTLVPSLQNETLLTKFNNQVSKTPNNVAIQFKNTHLTYKDFDFKINQVASYLLRKGIKTGDIVAVSFDRSLEMMIYIYGIIKAGAAYLPIDSTTPIHRINFIISDSKAKLFLYNNNNIDYVDNQYCSYISVNEINLDAVNVFSNNSVVVNPNSLAYVIYTSGTTGVPKGVMIEQHSVISLVHNNFINQTQEDTFAFLSSPVFDAATFEIWAPLLKGSALVIPKDSKQLFSDVKQFEQFIKTHHISILWLTKTLFDSLYFLNPKWCENLNYLIIGGEALDRKIINQILKSKRKPKHFLNGYGPTESTTFTCIYNLNTPIKAANVPIGKPINNRSVYILDTHRKPVPVGAVGELYIGGSGLARGYLNNSALTKHCFVNNLFATEVDKQKGHIRLYKTGDLVKWLPDGDIEYIGRKDGQVKIRGYRIELSEIEQALLKITGIQQSCVLVKNRKTSVGIDKYIVGYYVLDANRKLKERDITIALSKLLPSYLMPSSFLEMDNFPLTTNGKLDKKTFPDVEFTSQKTYVAPSTTLEKELCNIWQEVIGLEKIGITDDFFKIGGNSILAIKLVSVIRSTLKKEVTVKQLFLHGTIRKLVEIITISKSESEYLGEVVRLEKESFLAIDASNIKKLNKYSNPPKHVFLTGATGFVGCFLLHELLRRTTSNVYCLVRVDTVFNGKQKILNQLNDFGLNVKGFEDRILPVIGDLSKINLGINDRHYKFLEASLDYIYHAATHMDHFSSYSRLKKVNVGGIEEIIKLATTKVLKKVIYLSTTSGLKKTAKEKDSRKDEIHYSASGYSTSKWVGEDVLIRAIENGFPAQIYRLGLITGHVGDFKKPNNQWFTQLLESCSNLGAYPKGVTFSVLPVNFIAEALIQMSLKEHIVSDIFHLCNPNFLDLEYFFSRSFSKIEKMPLKDWLIKLKSRSDAFTSLPIVKFIDFEAENIKSIISGESNKTLFPIEVPCTQYTEERLDQEINITFPKMQKEYTV